MMHTHNKRKEIDAHFILHIFKKKIYDAFYTAPTIKKKRKKNDACFIMHVIT